MRNIQHKKGMSIGDLYPAVLTILMIGLVLGVGLYVLSTFHATISTDYSGSQLGINASTTNPTTLTDASKTNFNLSATPIAVSTNGTSRTNFTYTAAGVITWGSDIETDESTLVNVSYVFTYDAADSPEEALTTTIAGVATFADWIAIIVVVIAAAIVLGIVLMSFGRKRNLI